MSAFRPEKATRVIQVGNYRLEFGHASLCCMAFSNMALALYAAGAVDAQEELLLELFLLGVKTICELYFDKFGPDLLLHHLIMVGAFTVLQLPSYASMAYLCVGCQTIHVPLFFKHCWVVAERDNFFTKKSIIFVPAKLARKLLHSLFWPCWLFVVCFRTPFLLAAAAQKLPAQQGWTTLGFGAAVMYLDMLWTLEGAMSKSHGVVGSAVSEPAGWPAGLRTVKPWVILPCLAGTLFAMIAVEMHRQSIGVAS